MVLVLRVILFFFFRRVDFNRGESWSGDRGFCFHTLAEKVIGSDKEEKEAMHCSCSSEQQILVIFFFSTCSRASRPMIVGKD